MYDGVVLTFFCLLQVSEISFSDEGFRVSNPTYVSFHRKLQPFADYTPLSNSKQNKQINSCLRIRYVCRNRGIDDIVIFS